MKDFKNFLEDFNAHNYMALRAGELLGTLDIHDDLMIFITTLTGVNFKTYFVRFQDFKKFQDFTRFQRF